MKKQKDIVWTNIVINPNACPRCGSENIRALVYGLPANFGGKVDGLPALFMGCVVDQDSKNRACMVCHHYWNKRREIPTKEEIPRRLD